MTPIRPVAGKTPLAKKLLDALGVHIPVERVVIVVDAREPIRVYVKAPLDQEVVADVATLFETARVERLEVSDTGDVDTGPRG